jgi:hypothetical protein
MCQQASDFEPQQMRRGTKKKGVEQFVPCAAFHSLALREQFTHEPMNASSASPRRLSPQAEGRLLLHGPPTAQSLPRCLPPESPATYRLQLLRMINPRTSYGNRSHAKPQRYRGYAYRAEKLGKHNHCAYRSSGYVFDDGWMQEEAQTRQSGRNDRGN